MHTIYDEHNSKTVNKKMARLSINIQPEHYFLMEIWINKNTCFPKLPSTESQISHLPNKKRHEQQFTESQMKN